MRDSIWSRKLTKDRFSISLPFPILTTIIMLLVGGVMVTLTPSTLLIMLVPFMLAFTIILVLRQDALVIIGIVAINLYIDWYLGLHFASLVIALALLYIFFLSRSLQYPWVIPRPLWLWILFLGIAIFPAIHGALTLRDTLIYYPDVVFGAFIMFWLGALVARSTASVRCFFVILAGFGVLIAVHIIIQKLTGITLLSSSRADTYIESNPDYQLNIVANVRRLGSFFIQPDFAGIFFSMMIFIPLGLFVESQSFVVKILYLAETILMLPALLFTYSASAGIAALIGVIAFIVFVGRNSYRIQISSFVFISAIVLLAGFPLQLQLLLQHAADPRELILRNGLWQTAVRVIQAYPLTGVGLGHLAYLQYADPYRVPAQRVPIDHPHNSYLEWGAMAGLPVLIVFLALLSFTLWKAMRNWAQADVRTRSLLGSGIVTIIVLSVNSWSNEGWTLPPLAALGWLILGVISSPLLTKRQNNEIEQKKSNGVMKYS
jgi:O-antigen ligase